MVEGDWEGWGLGFFVMPCKEEIQGSKALQTVGNTPYISDWPYPA